MQNKVGLIEHDIIYVEKIGDQTAESMTALYEAVQKFAAKVRAQGEPVLILSNSAQEGASDPGALETIAKWSNLLDFDKSATYGSSRVQRVTRDNMISMEGLATKVANFDNRENAVQWLLAGHGKQAQS
jgi:hypothetical protein